MFHFLSAWLWPNAGSFGSRTRASVFGPMMGHHSSHVHAESGNRSRAELFLPPCLIWAIIGPNRFGYLGMLWCRLEQWFSNLSFKLPCPAPFVCFPYQTHLVKLISSLVETARPELGAFDKGDTQYMQGRGACRTGLKTTGLEDLNSAECGLFLWCLSIGHTIFQSVIFHNIRLFLTIFNQINSIFFQINK